MYLNDDNMNVFEICEDYEHDLGWEILTDKQDTLELLEDGEIAFRVFCYICDYYDFITICVFDLIDMNEIIVNAIDYNAYENYDGLIDFTRP